MSALGFKVTLHTAKGQFEETVKGQKVEIGRNVSADLPVMASGVSRSHLKLSQSKGKIFIKDLGSTNGTYIKGVRMEAHKNFEYEPGTRISLGQAGCFIRIEAIESNIPQIKEKTTPTETQIKKSKEETNTFYFFGKKGAKSQGEAKANQYMESAEKLVKKRISEAEDSIRKGMEKARKNAKNILADAKKESEIIKAKAELDVSRLETDTKGLKTKKIEAEKEYILSREKALDLKNKLESMEMKISNAEQVYKAKASSLNVEVEFLKSESLKKKKELSELVKELSLVESKHDVKLKELKTEFSKLNAQKQEAFKGTQEQKKLEKTLINKNKELELEHLNLAKKTKDLSIEFERGQAKADEVSLKEKEILLKANEKASEIERKASDLSRQVQKDKKDTLRKAKDEAKTLREKSLKEVSEIKESAKLEKEVLLKEIKELKESTQKDYDDKRESLRLYEKSEKSSLKEKLSKQRDEELLKLKEEVASAKIKDLKRVEDEVSKKQKLIQDYKKEYAEGWGLSISLSVEKALREKGDSVLKDPAAFRDVVYEIANSTIQGKRKEEETEIQKLMDFNPLQREKVKDFWKKTSFVSTGIIALLLLSPYLFKGAKLKTVELAKSGESANAQKIADFQEEVRLLREYKPEKRKDYLKSYTQRVLFTDSYAKNELDKSYREQWFLDLDTFFVETLVLPDEAVVTFISKETNLIKALVEVRDNINAQYVDEGIKRMELLEAEFTAEIKKLHKSSAKYQRFVDFKREHYLVAFPFDQDRNLAQESPDKEDQ